MAESDDSRDPRVYMAAERTFLAWIRTGVALMAFGFVVARFAVLMVDFGAVPGRPEQGGAASLWMGLGLILSGILTCIVSAVRHDRYVRAIDAGRFRTAFGSSLGYAIVALLALVGTAMVGYLLRL